LKVGIIIPWFGRELKGGAEQHAWQIASRLAERGHEVEVLTTCCRSHQDDWETNHFAPGARREAEGMLVRRFPVDARDRIAFEDVNRRLLSIDTSTLKPGISPVSRTDSDIFVVHLIRSRQLLQFVSESKAAYDRVILLPYLYGLILQSVEIIRERAILQPCLHDEAYAYLPQIADGFYKVGSIFFISEGEQQLASRLFGPGILCRSYLVGAGVEEARNNRSSPASNGSSLSSRLGRYVLYIGRKDEGKNVPLLVRAFSRFCAVRPNSDLRLVLAGHGSIPSNGAEGRVLDAGLVDDEQKLELVSHCLALAQPSRNESFSRVMMEAWFQRKPVAVHSRCLATSVAVQSATGGWTAGSEGEWAALFAQIDRTPARDLLSLGGNGERYAREMADWDRVIDRYEAALTEPPLTAGGPDTRPRHRKQINQFLPNLSYGDAISNYALFIRDHIRSLGGASRIYARFIDPRLAGECTPFSPEALQSSDAAIYHHSIGSEITRHLVNYSRPKCLIYHNITPPEFFTAFRPQFAQLLQQGREQLNALAPHFVQSYGVSPYNVRELANLGFHDPQLLPMCVPPEKWASAADPHLMETLSDGRTNIIFVGRIAPNKKQDDLVTAFSYYLALDPTARLFLIGSAEDGDPYAMRVATIIRDQAVEAAVTLTGSIPDAQLAAYYRNAHLFWSMSEHEGFCVPLAEAMLFDVPVLAFAGSAVPETLGKAAFLFETKTNLTEVASAAYLVIHDLSLRAEIIKAQRERRVDFLPKQIAPQLARLIDRLFAVSRPGR
jgi:glycosyltransferase involved in cell wall biosynthesis